MQQKRILLLSATRAPRRRSRSVADAISRSVADAISRSVADAISRSVADAISHDRIRRVGKKFCYPPYHIIRSWTPGANAVAPADGGPPCSESPSAPLPPRSSAPLPMAGTPAPPHPRRRSRFDITDSGSLQC